MSDDYTPADFWKGFGTWIGVILFVGGITGLVILLGWQVGWWFNGQNATRQYQVTQNGVSNQDTLRANIGNWFVLLLQEQRSIIADRGNMSLEGQDKVEASATASRICGQAEQVTGVPLPPDQAAWVRANCTMGVLSPASSLYIPMGN